MKQKRQLLFVSRIYCMYDLCIEIQLCMRYAVELYAFYNMLLVASMNFLLIFLYFLSNGKW